MYWFGWLFLGFVVGYLFGRTVDTMDKGERRVIKR